MVERAPYKGRIKVQFFVGQPKRNKKMLAMPVGRKPRLRIHLFINKDKAQYMFCATNLYSDCYQYKLVRTNKPLALFLFNIFLDEKIFTFFLGFL